VECFERSYHQASSPEEVKRLAQVVQLAENILFVPPRLSAQLLSVLCWMLLFVCWMTQMESNAGTIVCINKKFKDQ
jgi:hypothetical protein